MLDSLLDYGRHLPLLALTLAWLPPSSWLRLRRVRRCFLQGLCEASLREVAKGAWPPGWSKGESLLQLVDGRRLEEEAGSRAVSARENEVAACEAALFGLLCGLDVNAVDPATGIAPLMLAAEDARWHLCKLLLSWRADADSASVGGVTALTLALSNTCSRCLTSSGSSRCQCPRPAVARLLLSHTSSSLPEAFAASVRMALQDDAYIPVLRAFVDEKALPVDCEICGPDARQGTALSVALERRVKPVEAPLTHQPLVVATLLSLRAVPTRPGPYTAWWDVHGAVQTSSTSSGASDLLLFAAKNNCGSETLELLALEGEECSERLPFNGASESGAGSS
eukprot:TRINITY_DN62097_c0_g1_i1.p1 TRINITY_DN62097_c0_g1~~TRINITY_DN62097_c0_g1_i1.p1  ORF type:complete len:346 (-),score=82.73 TRINITY_DN62097_c0_g1_i1:25-1038(-)